MSSQYLNTRATTLLGIVEVEDLAEQHWPGILKPLPACAHPVHQRCSSAPPDSFLAFHSLPIFCIRSSIFGLAVPGTAIPPHIALDIHDEHTDTLSLICSHSTCSVLVTCTLSLQPVRAGSGGSQRNFTCASATACPSTSMAAPSTMWSPLNVAGLR